MPTVTGDNFYINKHTLQFRTGETGVASIVYDKTDESISIANAGTGQISIGDAGGDIYIGDGTTETDIIFEQNGAIRALTNKTLKLGQGDSDVKVEAQNFFVTGDAGFSGVVTINGNTVLTGASGAEGDTLQSVTDRGATTTNHIVTDNSAGIKLTRSSYDAFAQLYPAYSNVPTLLGGGAGGLHLGYASNVSGIRINTSNDVGIGTTNPSEKLHVDEGYILADGASTNHGFELRRDSADTFQIRHLGGNFTINNLTDNRKDLSIDGNGNVGIGTDIPATTLDLSKQNGLVELSIRRKGSDPSANTDIGGIQFKTDYTSTSHDVGRILVKTNSSPYRTDMKFSARSTAGTEMIGMTLHGTSSSGPYLGVGTETPSSLLHVRGSDPVLKITDSSTTDNSATLWLQESDTYGVKLNYESNGGNGGIDYLTIDTLSAAGGNNQAGNHDNAWGIDQRGYVMPHKGAVDGNLLKSYEWLLYGPEVSGSTPSFPQNGTTAENARIYGENPFGEPAILWYTPSNDTGDNADGGWNTDTFVIDRGKSYRTSVWVKKETDTPNDGNLYLGTNFVSSLNGTYHSNPYFIGGPTMTTAGMESGQWYLMVGYIYDSGHSGTANHPDGGIYDRNGQKLYDATSFKFTDSGSPSDGLNSQWNLSKQRVYNYYDQNTGSKTYWWGPRFEPLEASTPTIKELLNTASSDTGAFFAGNVGIGTTAPSSSRTLHVQGDAEINTNLVANTAVYTKDWYGIGSNDQRILTSAGTAQVTIKNGGNVGIGSASPNNLLDVHRADTFGPTIELSNSEYRAYINSWGSTAFAGRRDRFEINASATDFAVAGDSIRFQIGSAGDSYEKMRIASDGNVGIGSISPAYKLDVVDSDGGTLARFKDSDSSHAGLIIQGDTNGGSITNASAFSKEAIYLQNSASAIRFYTDGTEAVRIDSSQRVGIGTTSVLGSLQVNGRALIEGPAVPSTITISDSGDATKALRLGYEPTWDAGSISASDFGAGWKDIVIAPHAGKVGIGTTSPDYTLTVDAGGTNEIARFRSTDNDALISISDDTDTVYIGHDAALDVMSLGFNNSMGVSSNLNIDTNGSVGIGTNNPPQKLTVKGGITHTNSSNIQIVTMTNSSEHGRLIVNQAAGVTKVLLDSNGDSYLNGGDVGIGTSSPQGKLDINTEAAEATEVYINGEVNQDKLLYFRHYGNSEGAGTGAYVGYIGSKDNDNLLSLGHLKSDGSDSSVMHLTENGNVGIGVADPDATLEVKGAGNSNATTSLHVRDSDDQKLFMVRNDGVVTVEHNYFYVNANAGAYVERDLRVRGSLSNDQGTLVVGGDVNFDSNTLYVDSTNNRVGIGTNNPSENLHVYGGDVRISDGTPVLTLHDTSSSALTTLTLDGVNTTLNNAGTNGSLIFSTESAEAMRIDQDGNVGIGTISPTHELDVVGEFQLASTSSDSTNKVARIRNRHYTNAEEPMSLIFATSTSSTNVVQFGGGTSTENAATDCVFYTAANNTTTIGTERVRIDSDGNVSIGAGSNNHAGTRVHIQGPDTSPSTSTTAIDDCTLVLGNSDVNYGTVFATKSNGNGQIQQRRMASAVYYGLELNPHGGNVGIGTENPSYKLQVNGDIVGSSKSFLIDHPTQTGKKLMHACIEGPENGVYFRGKSQTSLIEAPEYWSGLVDIDTMTVDVTPIGPNQSIYVDRIEDNGDIYVGANTDQSLNYFYVVYGERKDIDKLEVVKDAPAAPPEIS